MYRVIGADGKEYGPFTAEQVQQWMAQGRLNAQSQVSAEGSGEWKPLGQFPEFDGPPKVEPTPTPAPPPTDQSTVMRARARNEVEGPATALLVVGILDIAQQIFSLVTRQIGMMVALRQNSLGSPLLDRLNGGPFFYAGALFGLAVAVLIIIGALKMKKMESYGLSMAASILAVVPCFSCCLGVPFGIWSLVVLTKPYVKEAFQYRASQ